MSLNQPGGQRAEINVTPMIDVLLVLIIIFMVILPHNSAGLKTEIPQQAPADAPAVARPLDIVVSIDKDRMLAINSQATTREELPDRLRKIFAERAQKLIFVQGHHALQFEDVATVIDIARGVGIYQIGLMTD